MNLENGKSAPMSELKVGDQVKTGTKNKFIAQIYFITYIVLHTITVTMFEILKPDFKDYSKI